MLHCSYGRTLKSTVCVQQKPYGMGMTYRKKKHKLKLRVGEREHFSVVYP